MLMTYPKRNAQNVVVLEVVASKRKTGNPHAIYPLTVHEIRRVQSISLPRLWALVEGHNQTLQAQARPVAGDATLPAARDLSWLQCMKPLETTESLCSKDT